MKTAALIPVKELEHAKARLASVLNDAGRRELVLSMLRDVLEAAVACEAIDHVAVVSRDGDVLALAEELGSEGLDEPGDLNEALESAAEKMASQGAERVVVVAADVPLATPEAIGEIAGAKASVALARSRDGGTNALALPPGAIPLRFGPSSARHHMTAAGRAGRAAERMDVPALALDIDAVDDLVRLRELARELGGAKHTLATLERIGFDTAHQ